MNLYINTKESHQSISSVERRNAGARSSQMRIGFTLISVVLGFIISLMISEVLFRVLEHRENTKNIWEGSGGGWFADGRWGWKPTKGDFHIATSEFDVRGHINALYMNDNDFDARTDQSRTRIFALGDSHTYAVGVSAEQAWPKVLERKLNLAHEGRFRVYNGGVSGYNMHQYLLRLIDQGPFLRPD